LLLVLIPWSAFWERNYFVEGSRAFGAVFTSNYTRGAVTGLGLINVWAALAELADLFGSRKSDASEPDQQSQISNQP
jgi:hypothetical protein